jgi:hypothetical protein
VAQGSILGTKFSLVIGWIMAGLFPGISEISNGEIKLERGLDKSELDLQGLLKGILLQRG